MPVTGWLRLGRTMLRLLMTMVLGFGLVQAQGNVVRVVAASDLQFALEEIAVAFERANPGIKVELNFGSSGKFYTQILQGLPADVYFSADETFPLRLEQAGMTVPGSGKLYAVGRLVIWVANELVAQGLDPQKLGPKLMLDKRVTEVAIANPVHAPYGRAAVTLLEHFGLLKKTREAEWEAMTAGVPAFYSMAVLQRGKPRFEFVYGENIAQTAQLALASTKVGILALSIAKSPALEQKGKYWLAPLSSHLRLNQSYAMLKGQDRPAVRKFYDYIATPAAHAVLRRYGFLLPGEKPDE